MEKEFQQLAGHDEAGLAGAVSAFHDPQERAQAAVSAVAERHDDSAAHVTSSGTKVAPEQGDAFGEQPLPAQPELKNRQNWRSYSYQELYDLVHSDTDLAELGQLGAAWTELGLAMKEHSRRMEERVSEAEAGQRGSGAGPIRELVLELVRWPVEIAEFADEVGRRVEEHGRNIARARAAMPEPALIDWDARLTSRFSSPGLVEFIAAVRDVRDDSERASAARDEAITVMTELETAWHDMDARLSVLAASVAGTAPSTENGVVQRAERGR